MKKNKRRVQIGRWIYWLLASGFALCVVAQIFLSGLATFVSTSHWANHVFFVHLFGLNIPILLLLFAFIGALPRWAYGHILGLMGAIFAMYFTANMSGLAPWTGALHPVIAML